MTDTAPPAGAQSAKVATEKDKQEVRDALPSSVAVPKLDPLAAKAAGQTHILRYVYAGVLLGFLLVQVTVANVAFFMYAAWGVDWDVPPVVISAWLGATVVEVIGVVYAITRSLFPLSDKIG